MKMILVWIPGLFLDVLHPLMDHQQLPESSSLMKPRLCAVYCSVLERPLQELREELQTDMTAALASYRKHCSSSCVSAGQVGRHALTQTFSFRLGGSDPSGPG